MNIPKINQYVPEASKSFNVKRFALSLILAISFFLYSLHAFDGYSSIGLTWPFVIAFVSYGCTGYAFDEYRYNKGKEIFREKLHEMELKTLVALTTSPEMTKDECDVVIHHLNSNHPGWSLSDIST